MKPTVSILAVAFAALFIFACSEDNSVVNPNATRLVADQDYYPRETGTFWLYRFDTTGVTGPTVKDVYRRKSTIRGKYRLNGVEYAVQENETTRGIETTYDTIFVRKGDNGIHATSFTLQTLADFLGLTGLGIDIPKEILLIPLDAEPGTSWSIFSFEYDLIVTFYFRVTARFEGTESVVTDNRTYKNCARIRVDLEALLPFPNPLTPTRINETGRFWFIKPGGLVVGDGSQIIFDILEGGFPNILNIPKRRVHQEVIAMDIVQPNDSCAFR